MAKKQAAKAIAPAKASSPHFIPAITLVLFTLVFYWTPLTSSLASIQWDAVDVHYSSQKYLSDHLRNWTLPHWTPYIFSGFPFLSDPQTGVWYPLNWPFFLLGITPGAIQFELALHALLAAAGAYFLAFHFLKNPRAALFAGIVYGFSGFFAGHSSHVGMFQTAAWLPWLLLGLAKSFQEDSLRLAALTGLAAGIMVLAGHFQTAIYSALICFFFAIYLLARVKPAGRRAVVSLTVIAVIALLVSAAMTIPGYQLLSASVRSGADFSASTDARLTVPTLATLVYPNALGAINGEYRGPGDITQFYFYGGVLLLPLAIAGAIRGQHRLLGMVLLFPSLWYAFGAPGGLFQILSLLPGLSSVRAPIHIWFAASLGLALLAAAGLKSQKPAVLLGILAFTCIDLAWWNSFENPLAYARASFEELYGAPEQAFQQNIGNRLPPLSRFYAPYPSSSFGSQNHPLDTRVETTYGYNPLTLRSYQAYMDAAKSDPKLLDVLGARFRLDVEKRAVFEAPAMPRVALPAQIVEHGEGFYRIHYKTDSAGVMRIAEAYYPGWSAEINGRQLEVFPADGALIGISAPAGEGEIKLRFETPRWKLAAILSLAGLVLALLFIARYLPRERLSTGPTRHSSPAI